MSNITTLGGENFDPSDKLQRLIAENSVYAEETEIMNIYKDTEIQSSSADAQTAAWLTEIGSYTLGQ